MVIDLLLHLNCILILNILQSWIIDSWLIPDVAAGHCEAAPVAAFIHEHEGQGEDNAGKKQRQYQCQ